MKQHRHSNDSARAISDAMEKLRMHVLSEANYDPERDEYTYEGEISIKEILSLAGVRSRSTLLSPHHKELRQKVHDLIADLKNKTGRCQKSKANSTRSSRKEGPDVVAMAQTIAALNFQLMQLQRFDSSHNGNAESKYYARRDRRAPRLR